MKHYLAVKMISGVVMVFEWDALLLAQAYSNRRVVGVVRSLSAEGSIPAEREANKLFEAGQYDRTEAGEMPGK